MSKFSRINGSADEMHTVAPFLQRFVRLGRRVFPRGWAPALQLAGSVVPLLRRYPAVLSDGSRLTVDLRQSMCAPYFFYGTLPHEAGVGRVLRRILYPGATFIDVGANIGYYTRMASRLVGSQGRIAAFEPNPTAFNLLIENTAGLRNVRSHAVALGNRSGTARFYLKRSGDTSSLNPSGAEREVDVDIAQLDGMLADAPRIDLIKIDVEGFELDVLAGAQWLLRRHLPVICFEYMDSICSKRGITLRSFKALLEPLGYRMRRIGGNNVVAAVMPHID